MRWSAAQELAAREERSVTKVLLSLVNDPSDFVRSLAVRALAQRNGTGVTQALLGAAEYARPGPSSDPDRSVPARAVSNTCRTARR